MAMVADPAFSAARSFRKVWGAIQVADAVQMVVSGNEPALYSSRAQFDYQPAADSEVWHPAAASFSCAHVHRTDLTWTGLAAAGTRG